MNELTAKDIMSRDVIIVHEKMAVSDLLDLFTREMISGAPVKNNKERITGVVSLNDIAHYSSKRRAVNMGERGFYSDAWESKFSAKELEGFHLEIDDGMCVCDIMTHLLISIQEDTPVTEIASIMIQYRVHRLCVTRDDKVVGLVTTTDILREVCKNEG